MDNVAYFKSINEEIKSLQNRIRNFAQHWPTDGEWKESILRTILRRHISKSIGVGKGFVVTKQRASSQQDILFYDTSKPALYQEGELLILSPDAALGAIEVKTKLSPSEMAEALSKLADTAELISRNRGPLRTFFGLFVYEGDPDKDEVLSQLEVSCRKEQRRIINCVSIGSSFFIRYWDNDPRGVAPYTYGMWHSYDLTDMAPAYFIFNAILHLCWDSFIDDDDLWFPKQGKEPYQTGSRKL